MNIHNLSKALSSEYSKMNNPISFMDSVIERLFTGRLSKDDVNDYDHYERLYKLRHDAVHLIICNNRGLEFGERKVLDVVGDLKDEQFHLVEKQTPDIMIKRGKHIMITEITVSTMKDPEVKKISKYSLLVKVLERNGFDVDLEIIVISVTQGLPDRNVLHEIHKLTHDEINTISDILSGFSKSLQRVHVTEEGSLWHLKFKDIIADEFHFNMSEEEIRNYYESLEKKPFNSLDDLTNVIRINEQSSLTKSDERILNYLTIKTLNDPSPYEKSDSPNIDKIYKLHNSKMNRAQPKNIINMPYIRGDLYDSSERRVFDKEKGLNLDDDRVSMFKGELQGSTDSYIQKIANMNGMFNVIKLSRDERIQDAIDGPGRKNFLNTLECPESIKIKEKEDTQLWLSLDDFDSDIEELSFELSRIDNRDDIKTLDDLMNARGPGLDYIRFFQSIMREIALNSNRKKRNHNYILRPTTIDGVFILIYPGPRLRTGEQLSQIFFKLLISKRVKLENLSSSWIFKKILVYDKCLMTKWISTDANRLDHYIRSFDKILMAYSSYMMYGKNDLLNNINSDNSNTLGMIILTYLEDKRSTSKMLQDVRYVVMASLSMYKYWDDILDKFTDPIRSTLQAYYLRRILNYIKNSESISRDIISSCKFGKSILDPVTHELSDKLSGSIIVMPRLLTKGPNVIFQQMLCEMYFTMLFNKNQDDPTHASHQILSKILEGDENLKNVKMSTKLHTGYSKGDMEDIRTLLENPMKNQFSRRVVMIASKLQSMSEHNNSPSGSAYLLASQNKFLNKTFDEFATYKSSALCRNKTYNKDLNVQFNDIGDTPEETKVLQDYKNRKSRETFKGEYENQNPRVRCISSIIALMTNFDLDSNSRNTMIEKEINAEVSKRVADSISTGVGESEASIRNKVENDVIPWKSFDLLKNVLEPNIFQVFKKNQIGGVREIIILSIKKRILINIMESFCRLICKEDSREMLTHGSIKFSLFRDMMRDLKRNTDKRIIMNYNFDKTKWGPSFMPIQFLYMFAPFRSKIPGLFNFILVSLMNHTNKECIIPEKLIKSWVSDPHNMRHSNKNLQNLKEKFRSDKKLSFINESNMGQGILHYTSSLFHLCVISLRHHLYIRACEKIGIHPGEFRELVSSDDSYTAHAMPMDDKNNGKLRVKLFLRAQWVTERLLNVWTSKSKSSISLLVFEFNSMFGSNLGVFPALFKFALSSVQPVNTDSFYRMVKESYNESRQIVENGGSLELYLLAQKLNKVFAEQMYHTNRGGQNDFRIKNIREENMPYHLGVFPIGNPSIMIMMGPEFHNYDIFIRLYKKTDDGIRVPNFKDFTENELKIWMAAHNMVELHPDVLASMNTFDNLFIGLTRIEAKMGPIHKLLTVRRQLDMKWDDVSKFILNNPITLFRTPETLEECKIKTYLKLYQNSASEALRTTAASIYYSRVAATVSAKAFHIPFITSRVVSSMDLVDGNPVYYDLNNNVIPVEEFKDAKTYMECLDLMLSMEVPQIDARTFYMYVEEYESLYQIAKMDTKYVNRNRMETQNIRSLTITKIMQKILNPIPTLLYKFWFQRDSVNDLDNSEKRDWINLKELTSVIGDSYEETLENLQGKSKEDKIRKLIMIILRLMSYGASPMKAVIYGPSSKSYETTFQILNNYNMIFSKTNEKISKLANQSQEAAYYSDVYHLYNYFILSKFSGDEPLLKEYIDRDKIELLFRDPGVSPSIKKRILMMLIYGNFLEDVETWTSSTNTILHNWDLRQSFDDVNKKYYGDFELRLQCGKVVMLIHCKKNKYRVWVNHLLYSKVLEDLLIRASELLEMKLDELIACFRKGLYKLTPLGVKNVMTRDGFDLIKSKLHGIIYQPADISFSDKMIILLDKKDQQILSTTKGLIQIDGKPSFTYIDFKIEGSIRFSSLISLGVFSPSFSIESLSPSLCLNSLDDIIVEKPKVSRFTMDRFELKDYDRRDENELMDIITESIGQETKEMNLISGFLIDESEIDDIKKIAENLFSDEKVVNIHEELLDFDLNIDLALISSHNNYTVSKPIALWNTVTHIKELLITRSVCDIRKLSSYTIRTISKILNNVNIFYSLLYVYDKIYRDSVTKSPEFISLNVPMEFAKKFKLI